MSEKPVDVNDILVSSAYDPAVKTFAVGSYTEPAAVKTFINASFMPHWAPNAFELYGEKYHRRVWRNW